MDSEHPAGTQVEIDAELLLLALETVIISDRPEAAEAERYGARIRFALGRVDDLRRTAQRYGGVFEAARLDAALSILDGHTGHARAFVERIIEAAQPPVPPRRTSRDIIARLEAAPEIDDTDQPRAA